jgi:hypothetical protein
MMMMMMVMMMMMMMMMVVMMVVVVVVIVMVMVMVMMMASIRFPLEVSNIRSIASSAPTILIRGFPFHAKVWPVLI